MCLVCPCTEPVRSDMRRLIDDDVAIDEGIFVVLVGVTAECSRDRAARIVEAEADQAMHAQLAHVAERHRRATSALGIHLLLNNCPMDIDAHLTAAHKVRSFRRCFVLVCCFDCDVS